MIENNFGRESYLKSTLFRFFIEFYRLGRTIEKFQKNYYIQGNYNIDDLDFNYITLITDKKIKDI